MIIGLTGTHGAGKGEVVNYLVSEKGFKHFSARALISEEVTKRNLVLSRETLNTTVNEMRRLHGADWVAKELYQRAQRAGGDAVIESLYTLAEIETLRKFKDFVLVAVDADVALRYQRIQVRASATDKISFLEFLAMQQRELANEDPSAQNSGACMAVADYHLHNNATLEDFYAQIDSVLDNIHTKASGVAQ